jgi:hypothetical protein
VAVALSALLLVAGCSAAERPLAPGDGTVGGSGTPGPLPGGGGTGGGGGSGGAHVDPALVGQWRATLLLDLGNELQLVTTTWSFSSTGGCSQRIETASSLAGFSDITTRRCTFAMANFAIDVRFTGSTGAVRFPYDFPGFSPTRLQLGGVEYQKL